MAAETFHYYAHRIKRDTYLGRSPRTTLDEVKRVFPSSSVSGNCVAIHSEAGVCRALESVFITPRSR